MKKQLKDASQCAVETAMNNITPSAYFDKQIVDLTDQIAKSPFASALYFKRGCLYYYRRRFYHALSDLDTAVKLDPDCSASYWYQAYSNFWLGNYSAAWKCVHKAQHLGEDNDPVFLDHLRAISKMAMSAEGGHKNL